MPRLIAMAPLLFFLPASGAVAQGLYLGADAGRCEVFAALSSHVPAECRSVPPRTSARALSRSPQSRLFVEIDPPPAATPSPSSPPYAFSTRIPFAHDSAQLSPAAAAQLDVIGSVLNDPAMARTVIRIVGHADASGSDGYNLALSSRRAQSVRHYLVNRYRIPPQRLQTEGRGERQLFDPSRPRAAINRRVEFINLTPQTQ